MLDEAKALLESIVAHDKARDGNSNDTEIGAALSLREAALAFVRKTAEQDVALAEMVDEFDHVVDGAWADNAIQFPRLLAEIHALIDPGFVTEIAQAMDLEDERVYELFERATGEFEKIKDTRGR